MFFSVFNQTTVWRGCCDLGNNFLKHIYIPNFFLNRVNQHAIWDAPGGNLFEGCFFFFWKVRTTQHPFALEMPVNTSQSPLAVCRRTKETAIFSQCFVISVFHSLENRIEDALHSLWGHSLEWRGKGGFLHLQMPFFSVCCTNWQPCLHVVLPYQSFSRFSTQVASEKWGIYHTL